MVCPNLIAKFEKEEMEKQEASKTTQSVPKSLTKVEERKALKRSGANIEEKKATEKKKVKLMRNM